jgi:DnaK suppressor protein
VDARKLLAEQRLAALNLIETMTGELAGIVSASRDTNADDEHDPEGSTIAFERAQVSALLGQARTRLGEIDRALQRVADGSYGRCVRCGRPIPDERLAVRPAAIACADCAALVR